MREAEFRDWMNQHTALKPTVKANYISYCRTVENTLNINIDDEPVSRYDEFIGMMPVTEDKNQKGHADNSIKNYRNGLKKYAKFRDWRMKDKSIL